MKVKVESEKIIKAVKKLEGIEIVLENANDAKEAINLILQKTELFKRDEYAKLKEIKVTSFQEYKTSAVDYKMVFLLEFFFEDDVSLDTKVAVIREFQEFFGKIWSTIIPSTLDILKDLKKIAEKQLIWKNFSWTVI